MKNNRELIFNWYNQNKRNLPWRHDKDPYHVWISEIMLQQTRIEAVIDYYHRFMNEIPDIETLANIEEDKLLKLWEGLGYYNRAKNLKKAAIEIMTNYHGNFPTTYVEIIKLPGIGEYTASAISSICFNEPQVTIDGNVLRVYARFYNDKRNVDDPKTKKAIREELMQFVPKESGSFNQGLMEIGETICLPNGLPKCEICPLKNDCLAKKNNTYLNLPVKEKKKDKKEEDYTVLLYHYQNKYAIYKRTKETLLNNLWAFPVINKNLSSTQLKEYLKVQNIAFSSISKEPMNTHIFTHKKWNMTSYIIELKNVENMEDYKWVTKKDLEHIYAIPTAFQPFREVITKKEEKQK